MDPGLPRFDKAPFDGFRGGGLAVLMVGIVSRQAASPTARTQSRLAQQVATDCTLAPRHGAFHARAAAASISRQQG